MPNSMLKSSTPKDTKDGTGGDSQQQNTFPTTLLAHQYKYVCSIAMAVYLTILYAFWYVQKNSACKICEASLFPVWTKVFNGMTVGATSASCLIQFTRIFTSTFTRNGKNTTSAFYTMFIMTLISASSQIFNLMDIYDTTCLDAFDIKTPVVQWAEWHVTVPLMFYLSVTLDSNKKSLDYMDWIIMISATGGIFFVFATNWGYSFTFSITMICMAVASLFTGLWLLFWTSWINYSNVLLIHERSMGKQHPFRHLELAIVTRKLMCSLYLAMAFPLFPAIYFLGVFDVVSKDTVVVITLLLNFSVKLMYALLVMDSHLEVLDPNSYQLEAEQRANESRRAFLRYVFHEVRVPLNSISMGLHVLFGNAELSSEDKETVAMMREATGFMTETLNDVLSLQKIEEGKLELTLQKTYIRGLVRSVQMSLRGHLQSKSIEVICDVRTNVPKCVIADKFRLEHVLANLMSNAIKFSKPNSRIWIVVRSDDAAPNIVTISVIDEGMGILPEDQKALFTPYMQIRPGELQKGRGTGVGLAICREIVLLHGGRISVNSKYRSDDSTEGGSEFYLTIPFEIVPGITDDYDAGEDCAEDADTNASSSSNNAIKNSAQSEQSSTDTRTKETSQTSASSSSSSSNQNEENNSLSKLKILIVDDVTSNRKMLNMLLSKKGLNCDLVADGIEAVEIIDKNGNDHYDLVFMDNMMPIMSGVVATTKLRSNGFSNIIVGLTGNALDEDILEFIEAGADVVLSKPLKIPQLDKLLKHLVIYGTKTTVHDSIAAKNGSDPTIKLLSMRKIIN